jgi:hypothetical protein
VAIHARGCGLRHAPRLGRFSHRSGNEWPETRSREASRQQPADPTGRKVRDYPRFALRLPTDVRAELDAAAKGPPAPAWRVVIDATMHIGKRSHVDGGAGEGCAGSAEAPHASGFGVS